MPMKCHSVSAGPGGREGPVRLVRHVLPRSRGAGRRAALSVGLVLLLAVPTDSRRKENPEFAPVSLDHLFTDDLNLTAASTAGREDDEVCLDRMCWNNEARAALSNIVRAYLRPKYGVHPVFEKRLLQGLFKSLLFEQYSAQIAGDIATDERQKTSRVQSSFVGKWFSRRKKRHVQGDDEQAGDTEGGMQHSREHYLATFYLMLSRTFARRAHQVSKPELRIAAYLAESWIYDPYPTCLTLSPPAAGRGGWRGGGGGGVFGNYTMVRRSDGHRVSYKQTREGGRENWGREAAGSKAQYLMTFEDASRCWEVQQLSDSQVSFNTLRSLLTLVGLF
jgi:hypothetical protein